LGVVNELARAQSDPVLTAKNLFEAWRAYYKWVASRLGPAHAAVLQSDVFARAGFRSSLRGCSVALGEGVLAKIRHEVLGEAVSRQCTTCGAVLDAEADHDGNITCRFCGAAVRIETDDPWITGVLSQWKHHEERFKREGKLDTPEVPRLAIQLALSP